MKTYIYKGAQNFFFYDVCIATFGELLEIDGEEIRNISNENRVYKAPKEIIEKLLSQCAVYNSDNSDNLDNSDEYEEFFSTNKETITRLVNLGILKTRESSCRDYNVGKSNYSKHVIQPWAIWQDYELNPWDADIVKRVLRTKVEDGLTETEARIMDYEKIIHICKERIRQLKGY